MKLVRKITLFLYKKMPEETDWRQHPELDGHYSNALPLVEVNP